MIYTCTICNNPIAADQPWQYAEGAYISGTEESERTRVHQACFSVLLRQTIELLAAVPPEERGDDMDWPVAEPAAEPTADEIAAAFAEIDSQVATNDMPTLAELVKEQYLERERRRQRPEDN